MGDAAWEALVAFAAAALDCAYEFVASLLLGGVLMRAQYDVKDVPWVLGAVAVMFVPVRRLVRSDERAVAWRRIPGSTTAPTASWAHIVWAGALITLGVNFVSLGPPLSGWGYAMCGLCGLMLVARGAARWLRR